MSAEQVLFFIRHLRLRPWHWVALTLLGLGLLLMVFLPGFLRREITTRLATATTAEVRLDDVDVSLLRGRFVLQGLSFTLSGEEQPVIAVRQFVGNLRMLSLLSGAVSLEEVLLTGLHIAAVQQQDGQLNLSRLFPTSPPAEPPPPESDLPTLTVERLAVSAVEIDYQDRSRPAPAHFALTLEDLSSDGEIGLQAKGLAAPVNVRVKGRLNDGPMQGDAQVLWTRTQTSIEAAFSVNQLALTAIEPYVHGTFTLQHLAGSVDARVQYRYHTGGDQPPAHRLNGALTLKQVAFADPVSGQTLLDLPTGQVTIETVDLLAQEIRLTTAELLSPKLFFLQTPTGLNWSSLVSPPDQAVQTETPSPATAPAWRFSLQEARLTGGEIVYRDSAWSETEAISLAPEEVSIQQIGDLTAKSPLQFRLKVAQGILAGDGTLQISPFSLQTQTQLTGIELTQFQPVVLRALAAESVSGTVNGTVKTELETGDRRVTAKVSGAIDTANLMVTGVPEPGQTLAWENARFELTDDSTVIPLALGLKTQFARISLLHLPQGDLSIEKINGDLRIDQESQAVGVSSPSEATGPDQSSPAILAQGMLEVSSFLLTNGPEKQETLSCYLVRVKLNAGSRLLPLDLRLSEVALEYPYVQGFRTTAGQVQMFTPDSAPSSPPATDAPPESASASISAPDSAARVVPAPSLHIERVTLIGGQIYFEDRFISPQQTVYWQDLRIDLSDVRYPLNRPAAFTLHAFNMDGAPIEVRGTTQRQGDVLLTHIHGTVERLSLPRFNVYVAPLLGYVVRRGAVSVSWDLTIPGDKVKASTTVTLHDLGLSGKQSSSVLEEQVGLPLQLVVALLKDLNGNINLQLPVEGQFGDPGFRLGGTILRALRDVLIGAVTSPLKLLGAVFSGGDKGALSDFSLEPIRFVPGTAQPTGAGKEQLARLENFLAQRPELGLQLSGHSGPQDEQALQDRLILAQLQAQTPDAGTQDSVKTEEGEAPPLVTPREEVRQFLVQQLEPPGKNGAPALSAEAVTLLAQLREQVPVAPQLLENLAQERMQMVIAALTANSAISASRLRSSAEQMRGREGAEVRYMVQAKQG